MWTLLGSSPENQAPSSRTKHSATLLGTDVYLFGGRNGNLPLKDLWKYSLTDGIWSQLNPTGDRPPCLQEHSAVAYKDCIYVFGGEIGFSAGTETPLWKYDTKNNSWRKIPGSKGRKTPKGRRGHSALVHCGSMIIYGGYEDLRGSSNELWNYHFETESWHLLSPKPGTDSLQRPSGRHKHSAVLHDGAMWIYGGMTDLQERGDLWRWDITSRLWYNVKAKPNPGPLHSHAVCKLPSSMLIFGGETNGLLLNDLWRFHFGTEVWEKLQFPGKKPHPRAESIALAVSELLFKEETETGYSSISAITSSATSSKLNLQSQGNFGNRGKNNKIGPVEKKYVFNECSNNYASGNLVTSAIQNNNLSFLKEISKLSSINLSRLNRKSSYTVLNSSHDSTESLLKTKESSDNEQTPTRMVKSQSANVIANKEKKKTFPVLTPAVEKLPNSILESAEFSIAESDQSTKSLMPRDLISVPNLTDFTNTSRASLSVDNDTLANCDENNLGNAHSKLSKIKNVNITNANSKKSSAKDVDSSKINLPGTPFSNDLKMLDSKIKNVDSYDFSKRCQSDSYSSHLVSLGNEESAEILDSKDGIPKSASVVRFKKYPEIADELTSDYCSIETVNKISLSSDYSQSPGSAQRELFNDYPELKFGRSTDASIKKNSGKGNAYGFSNPHYLGPDVKTILKTNDVKNYGKILNSPPDSVLEDTGKTAGKLQKENVEMTNINRNNKVNELNLPKKARSPPRYLPLRGNPYNPTTAPLFPDKKKKFRTSSAGRINGQELLGTYLQRTLNEEFSNINMEPMIPLSVFLIGGKEHGQITVFKRPISLWKLRLSSNVY